jgi:hypothetical protein
MRHGSKKWPAASAFHQPSGPSDGRKKMEIIDDPFFDSAAHRIMRRFTRSERDHSLLL